MSFPMSNDSGYIFLYNGAGADSYCVEKAKTSFTEYLGLEEAPRLILADSSYIVRDLSPSGKAVVFTGGNAHFIQNNFKEEGIRSLSKAILHDGCTYIGFCSGSYLAGRFSYHSETRSITRNYELNFIESLYKGPAFPLGKDAEHLGTKTAKASQISFGSTPSKTCHVFWNGGGAYESYNPENVIKVASYTEPEFQRFGNIVALCDLHKGRGKVICTSVHPEIQLDHDEVQGWCPEITEEKRELLVNDAPLQKEFLAEICNLVDLKGEAPNHWKRYY